MREQTQADRSWEPLPPEQLASPVALPLQLHAQLGRKRRVHGAVVTWLTGVWALCWFGLPALGAAAGLDLGVSEGVWGKVAGFAATVCVVLAALELLRPRIDPARRREPVIAAALGVLLTWGAINAIPFLFGQASVPPAELAALVGMNVVEAALFGVVLASFARSRLHAFALGVAFEGALMGLTIAAWARFGI